MQQTNLKRRQKERRFLTSSDIICLWRKYNREVSSSYAYLLLRRIANITRSTLIFAAAEMPINSQLPQCGLLEELSFHDCYPWHSVTCYLQPNSQCLLFEASERLIYPVCSQSSCHIRLAHHQNLYSSAAVLVIIITTDYYPLTNK